MLRRIDEAFANLDRAIALDPQCADYHWNRALFRLTVGNFDEGWQGREWGRKCALVGFVDRKFTQPHWFGEEPIAGKTILLHSDEGLGDSIQYSRYAAMVAKLGARVILEVEAPLHPLLTGMEGVSLCLPKVTGVEIPPFDLHCPLGGSAACVQDAARNHPGFALLSSAAAGTAPVRVAGTARRA